MQCVYHKPMGHPTNNELFFVESAFQNRKKMLFKKCYLKNVRLQNKYRKTHNYAKSLILYPWSNLHKINF